MAELREQLNAIAERVTSVLGADMEDNEELQSIYEDIRALAAQPAGAAADKIGFHSFDPDDRFYHAADRTWWRSENGRLVRASAPASRPAVAVAEEVNEEVRRQIEWAVQKLADQYGENGDTAVAIIRAFVLEGSQK